METQTSGAVSLERRRPFHVPNTVALEAELDFTLDKVWKPLLKDLPRPVLVNLVRSPTYLPEHMLNTVECRVLSLLSNLYKVTTLHHEPRVSHTSPPAPSAKEFV